MTGGVQSRVERRSRGFDQPRLARLRFALLDDRGLALADHLRGGESAEASEVRVLA